MKREDGSRAEKNMNSDDVSRELISDARNELYLAMRYLFLPLNSLVPKEDRSNYFIATDGSYILYNPVITRQKSMISPVVLNRAYLHTVLHCMFSHPFVRPAGLNEELWDIACDVAVESIIDSLSLKCVMQVMPLQREEAYKKLNDNMTLLDANNVYEYLNSLDRGGRLCGKQQGHLLLMITNTGIHIMITKIVIIAMISMITAMGATILAILVVMTIRIRTAACSS